MIGRSSSSRSHFFWRFVLSAAAASLLSRAAHAQTWDGGGAAGGVVTWNTVANWNPDGVPANNGTAAIVMGGTFDTSNTVDINFDIASLTFANSGGTPFTIGNSGGATLTIRTGGITNNDADTQTINVPIIQTGASPMTWNALSGDILFGGNVTFSLASTSLIISGNNDVIMIGVVGGSVLGFADLVDR